MFESLVAQHIINVTMTQVGPQGSSLNWRGSWLLLNEYVANDIVENLGTVYICILANTGATLNEPGAGADWQTYWDLMVSPGVGGQWGTIAGTLSNQTDLQAALNAKQNVLTGLTASVAELNFTDGVTSNIQTQLDAKADDTDLAGYVAKTGNESVAGQKTFTDLMYPQADALFGANGGVSMYHPSGGQNHAVALESVLNNFQSGHGFVKQSAAGTQTDDTTIFIKGSQSLKLTTDGLGSAVFTRKASISPNLNITRKQIKIWLRIDDPTKISELFVYLSSDNLSTAWYTLKPSDDITSIKANTWVPVTFSFGRNSTTTGSPNKAAINCIQVRCKDDTTGAINVWYGGIESFDEPQTGVISITFDDGFDGVWNYAKPYMDKYGYAGVEYVITSGRIGTSGYMTLAQLKVLQTDGWDISNHTKTHGFLSQQTPAEIEQEFYDSQNWLIANGFTKGAQDLALPHGDYDETVVLPIVKKYFRSCRTIVANCETIPPADQYKLRVYLVLNTTTTTQLQTAITNAINNKEWLILVFHQIVTSGASQSTQYLKADFETVMDFINSSSGVVRTVSDVFNRYIGLKTTADITEVTNLFYTDERVDDRVNSLLVEGAGIDLTYDDTANTLTIASTITQYTDEMAQDTVATMIQNGTGISWTYSDVGNTLTPTVSLAAFSTTNLSEGSNLYYTDERVDDRVSALLVAGTGIGLSYNDAGNALTISTVPQSAYIAKTANYTATTADSLIDCTSNTFTVTLYTAVGNSGRQLVIKNSGTGIITIDGNASETIDGQLTFVLGEQYDSITIRSDGANWIII